jgi:4-diphosphocytidyl-2C-methyl-D-erythritol kinase
VITASAPGKINLVFQVGGLRPDGYHEVASIYQGLDLREEVSVAEATSWQIALHGDVPGIELVPLGDENLVIRAAKELAQVAGIANPQPMRFEIKKSIPVAGGMAGGSADAAAALLALNQAWELGFTQEQLLAVGSRLGADVPFSILGGTALGTGTGTKLLPLPASQELHVLLIFSDFGLSTAEVFRRYDQLKPQGDQLSHSLQTDYLSLLGQNSLTEAALSLQPGLSQLLSLELGISGGFLSGSGPTVWFCDSDESRVLAAAADLTAKGHRVVLTKTSQDCARLL